MARRERIGDGSAQRMRWAIALARARPGRIVYEDEELVATSRPVCLAGAGSERRERSALAHTKVPGRAPRRGSAGRVPGHAPAARPGHVRVDPLHATPDREPVDRAPVRATQRTEALPRRGQRQAARATHAGSLVGTRGTGADAGGRRARAGGQGTRARSENNRLVAREARGSSWSATDRHRTPHQNRVQLAAWPVRWWAICSTVACPHRASSCMRSACHSGARPTTG